MTKRTVHLPVVFAAVDRGVAELVESAKAHGHNIPCTDGCDACCLEYVPIVMAEARELVRAARAQGDTTLRARCEAQLQRVRGAYTSWRYFRLGEPCVFLKDHRCSVYDARPVACRSHFVRGTADQCKKAIVDKMRVDEVLREAGVYGMADHSDFTVPEVVTSEHLADVVRAVCERKMLHPFAALLLRAMDEFDAADAAQGGP